MANRRSEGSLRTKTPPSMKHFFNQLRADGFADQGVSPTDGGIWEMVGTVPKNGFYRRFGSSADVAMFYALRCISIVDALWVPFALSFLALPGQTLADNVKVQAAELLSGALYSIGVVLRFVTSVVDVPMGREYVEFKDITAIHCRRATFWMDLFSLPGGLWWCSRSPIWQRILGLKLLRIWRLPPSASQAYDTANGTGERWVIFTVVELLGSILMMCHFFACAWFASLTWTAQDIKELQDVNVALLELNLGGLYFQCLRDGAAMLVGWGQPTQSVRTDGPDTDRLLPVSANFVWVIAGPLGSMYMAVVFALLLVAIERTCHTHTQHIERMEKIRAVLNSLLVPVSLKERVLRYHAFLSVHNVNRATYDVLFEGLSTNLNIEIKLVLFENLVMTAPFFQDVPPSIVMQMVMAFDEEVFSPGEVIVRKGAVGNEMFFIIKGACEVLPDDEAVLVVCVKELGDYFGEVALVVEGQPRTAWVRARTFCILAKLTRLALQDTLKCYPEIRQRLAASISGYNLAPLDISQSSNDAAFRESTPLLHHTSPLHSARSLCARNISVATGARGENWQLHEEIRQLRADMQQIQNDVRKIAGSLGHTI